MSCCVCCGCCCNYPRKIQIASCILAIPVSIALSAYVIWMAFGTYLVAAMDGDRRNRTICRNIQVYIFIMYAYLLCLVIFGIIISIWKLHSIVKKSGGGTSSASAAERGAKADTEKQMKNMQRGAKLAKLAM